MPPTPSAAWKYFTRSSDKKSATCNLCGANLKYIQAGTTSNLLNHINNKHPSSASSNDAGDSKKQSSRLRKCLLPKVNGLHVLLRT
ncbi:hypothetical protein DPMN_107234 [Dreissena polymorpha]|uniref:BED-type domain-containing protein n=1 Tax=Dreissena polymorpha TaxID=45954 RepID=A0A9D4K6D2_DREPO|nr:hypothetical protein DPMN_107234 [Dreissena polymorpha]